MIDPKTTLTRWLRRSLFVIWAGALFLTFHNFAIPLLPDAHVAVTVGDVRPETPGVTSYAYAIPLLHGNGNPPNDRCKVSLYEDGELLYAGVGNLASIRANGHGAYTLENGRLIFSARDNSDPRTNHRDYDAYYPILYRRDIGYVAVAIFILALLGLSFLPSIPPVTPAAGSGNEAQNFRLHLIVTSAILLLALYCSTGTLSPYANNGTANALPPHNYLYNPDHEHFRALFKFVDGQDRSTWDGAIFLRRILFPVLAYPFMKLWGFEAGGTIFSLLLNVSCFAAFLLMLRRLVGARGAIVAAWLLALYPGAGYWGGLPYVYSTIVPFSLLLSAGLLALHEARSLARIAVISLLMGVAYLGYDLIVYYLPASILVLLWRRKLIWAGVAAVCQCLLLLAWLVTLRYGLHQALTNSNSAAYGVVLNSYLHVTDYAQWWQLMKMAPALGLTVFFGCNFIFLPALFLLLVGVNAATARIWFHPVEVALLAITCVLFLFNNLAPSYAASWQMRGTWIARLYQPCLPVLVLFVARWFQAQPSLSRPARLGLGAVLLATAIGNALVVFGPILNNPLRVSETVFFAFAESHLPHSYYEANLEKFGRRPLGFPEQGKE